MSDKLIPNTFQCPNAYLDELGALLDDGEFKTLMYLVRHIYGWQDKIAKSRARLSLSKIASGFTTKEGTVYTGSGQSEPTVSRCLKSLAEFGIIRQSSKNNLANEGAEWELLPHSRIKFDALKARKGESKSKVRTQHDARLKTARANRRLSGLTSSDEEGPLSGLTAGGKAALTQVVKPLNTTNPLKPNSNPLSGEDAGTHSLDLESPTLTVSDSTKPSATHPMTQTPIPQTDRLRTGNMAQFIYENAMRAKANPALATIRKWDLPAHLAGICEDYVEVAHGTVVKASDKKLFLVGASDIYELFKASGRTYSRAWMEQAIKTANWSHAHPRALDKSFRELFKSKWKPADAPANDGTVHVGYQENEKGEMVEVRKRVVAHV